MRALAAILALAIGSVVGCGGGGEQHASDSPFGYDTTARLQYVDRGVVNKQYPIAVHDVSYSTPAGSRIDAMLVVPPGKGPFPGIVYLHGSPGERTQLLVPATWLAARGVVALTITMPQEVDRTKGSAEERLVAEREAVVETVVAARRAVDVLESIPSVDRERIGLIGWSGGARIGAILAGAEPRIGSLGLLSAGSTPVEEYAARAPEELRPAIERELGSVDPLRWIGLARPDSILLQNGRSDEVVPKEALQALLKAAGPAARVKWYDQGHAPSSAAFKDQLGWFVERFDLDGSIVKGAAKGP